MNEKSQRGSHLEIEWHSIGEAEQLKGRCPQLLMKWISIASPHALLNI